MIDKILNIFTKLQDKLYSLTDSGIDVQKVQTFVLVCLCLVHSVYSIVFLLTFQWKDMLIAGSFAVILFYYAMAMNQVLNEDE